MGHGPLINQTYEVIRGPAEAKATAREGRATGGESQRLTAGKERSCLKHKLRRSVGRVRNAGVGAGVSSRSIKLLQSQVVVATKRSEGSAHKETRRIVSGLPPYVPLSQSHNVFALPLRLYSLGSRGSTWNLSDGSPIVPPHNTCGGLL